MCPDLLDQFKHYQLSGLVQDNITIRLSLNTAVDISQPVYLKLNAKQLHAWDDQNRPITLHHRIIEPTLMSHTY